MSEHHHRCHHDECCRPADVADSRSLTLVETATLLALAAFLVGAAWSGRVRLFVAPAYLWLPPAAGGLLLAMAASRCADLRRRGRPTHTHGSRKPAARALYAATVLLPIGLALFVNPQQFSAEGVRKRRAAVAARDIALEQAVAWILGQSRPQPAPVDVLALPAEPTLRDVLAVVEQGHGRSLEGRFVTLIGQCSLAADGQRFDLYRMLVTCCIADAQAISIEVVSPAPPRLDEGQWVRVGGVLCCGPDGDLRLPVLHAAKIEKIPLPSRPYL